MTLSTFILSVFITLSCSNQEQPLNEEVTSQEELTSMTAKTLEEQKYDYLYGNEIYYRSAEAEIKRLESIKTKLVAELENGNKGVMEEIEKNQIEIKKLIQFIDFLTVQKPILGPGGPIPTPYPCTSGEKSNCDPKRKLSSKTLIVLGKELIVLNVIIKNMKNQLVDAKFQPVEDQFSQSALELKSSFMGEGIMYTTLKTDVVGEITIPTPVVGL